MTLPKLLVSDFAGTVFKDDGAVLEAYRTALSSQQLSFTDDELRQWRGANKLTVLREFAAREYPDEEAERVARKALESFEHALEDSYRSSPVAEVPGAEETIGWLGTRGCAVALTTGLPRSLVGLLLARLGWQGLFDAVITGDDVTAGRPAPFLIYRAMQELEVHDVRLVAVIGDTPLDLAAGMNARAGWVIGVLSGAHTLDTLGSAAHTHLIPSIANLPSVFMCPEPAPLKASADV